jgi:flagellar basal-body rod modification protein FlgD
MPTDTLGGIVGVTQSSNSATSLDQEEFVKLFLTELNFQDPLEPIDNREFLAQIADFASLEQSKNTTDGVLDLLKMNSDTQVLGLLGRTVTIEGDGGVFVGEVGSAVFTADGPRLTIVADGGDTVLTDIRLSQIRRIQ